MLCALTERAKHEIPSLLFRFAEGERCVESNSVSPVSNALFAAICYPLRDSNL